MVQRDYGKLFIVQETKMDFKFSLIYEFVWKEITGGPGRPLCYYVMMLRDTTAGYDEILAAVK